MSSCLKKGSIPSAIICPNGEMYVQGYEPKWCSLGTPGRKYTCNYFSCEKCHKAFRTCKKLKLHKIHYHSNPFSNKNCYINNL
jgi:hypothetical protein